MKSTQLFEHEAKDLINLLSETGELRKTPSIKKLEKDLLARFGMETKCLPEISEEVVGTKEAKEEEVLQAISDYWECNCIGPTMRELCEQTGLNSTASMWNRIEKLKEKGLVTSYGDAPRSLRLVGQQEEIHRLANIGNTIEWAVKNEVAFITSEIGTMLYLEEEDIDFLDDLWLEEVMERQKEAEQGPEEER